MKAKEWRKGLYLMLIQGMLASAISAIVSPLFVPFLVSLGLGAFEIGVITAIRYISQALRIPLLMFRSGSNKGANLLFSMLGIIGFAGIITSPFIMKFGWIAAFVTLYYVSQTAAGVFFIPWFFNLVPRKFMNRYRSKRFALMLLVGLAVMLSLMVLLPDKPEPIHYAAVLSVALGLLVASFFIKAITPERMKKPAKLSMPRGIWKFAAFSTVLRLGDGFSIATIPAYFISSLGKGPSWYVAFLATSQLVKFIVNKTGKAAEMADMGQGKRILRISAAIMPVLPIAAVFASNPIVLVLFGALDGLAWALYSIADGDIIFKSDPKRVKEATALVSTLSFFAMGAGSFLAGWISEKIGLAAPLFLSSAVRGLAFLLSFAV